MKTKLTTRTNTVTIAYDHEDHFDGITRVERTFTCPASGGYVTECLDGEWKQVCYRLGAVGTTLHCASFADLPALIRREYRAMRKAK